MTNPDDDTQYLIQYSDHNAELGEIEANMLWFSEVDRSGNVYSNTDIELNPETIVKLVENSIDDIKGDSLTMIIEIVVKKLNRFKSLIESARSL